MGHVAKHSAGAGSNRDRSAPPSKPGEPAETPAEPVAVKPGEPGERPDDPAGSVVVEPKDTSAAPRSHAGAERPVVRPTMPVRGTRRWWQLGRGDDEPRPVSHAAGAKSRPGPDEHRDPSPGVSRDRSGPSRAPASGSLYGRSTASDVRAGAGSGVSPWGGSGPRAAALGDRSGTAADGPEALPRLSRRDGTIGPDHGRAESRADDGAEPDESDEGSVKLREGERSGLRPTAPTGTPTYEGTSAEDTAVLPRLGQPLQTQRIWTTRPDPPEHDADDKDAKHDKAKNGKNKKIDVTSLLDVGIKLLPEIEPGAPDGPITNARWAALVRSAARRMIWTLPVGGVVAGAASIGAMVRGGPAYYLNGAEPFRLIAWVTSVWFGMVAMICLVGMLAAVRVRATALLGLMLGLLGGISMLMFAAVPPATPIWGLSAKTLTLSCGALYSAGWMAMGWAVFRSRMFTRGDGLLLICAGPMVGIAGLWMSPFHTAGALLMIAGGLGIAWKSGSTLRAVRAGREAELAERAGPPLELAEIRPRRVRKPKPPKAPKPSKPSKRQERRAKRAEADAAKQADAAKRAAAKQADATKRNGGAKQADGANRNGSANRNASANQNSSANRNDSASRNDSARQSGSARQGDPAAQADRGRQTEPSEWSRQGSRHSRSDRSGRPGETDQSHRPGTASGGQPAATSPGKPAKDDKAPRGPGKRRLRVDPNPPPPPTSDGPRRKRWGFKRDRED